MQVCNFGNIFLSERGGKGRKENLCKIYFKESRTAAAAP